jgi:hypothetical protein
MEVFPDPNMTLPPAEQHREPPRPVARRRRTAMEALTIGDITSRNRRMYYQAIGGFAVMLLAGLASVAEADPEMAWPYAVIATTSLVALWIWAAQVRKGIPILPTLVVQQSLVYLMPIFVQNITIQGYDSRVMDTSALSVGVFFLLLPLGWKCGRGLVETHPSRWILDLRGRGGAGVLTQRIALIFLGLSVAFEVFSKLGLMAWIPTGFMPVVRAILGSLAAFGAFLGGFVIAGHRKTGGATSFWTAFYLLFFLSASGLLLSGVTLMVVAAGMGLGLGRARIPWRFVITVSAILSFLNVGKFDMRAKYWGESGVSMSLASTPSLYAEWIRLSFEKLANRRESELGSYNTADTKGQSLLERMNNLQNMVFVVNAQQALHAEPLWGKTYALIPPLFIPRFLWSDKPRTHAGQILLNLHFGRQGSVEQTEKTYIAWGFLPEAVGNFGPLGGAIFLGPVMGFLIGMLESWSVRKHLFSIEGLVIVGLLLQILTSFEMVASVFLTATFQMTLVLVGGGYLFHMALASKPQGPKRVVR